MIGRKHSDAVGFVQPRQVIKVRILAKFKIGVLVAADFVRAGEDGDARRFHLFQKLSQTSWSHSLLLEVNVMVFEERAV
jgi:hypothetical protein